MTAPQLIALNKLGEIRNQDPTLYQVLQELQQQVNQYILGQAGQPAVPGSVSTTNFKARAYQNVAQSIPDVTATKINLDTISYDPNANLDVVTNRRWTCPAAGYYYVHVAVSIPTVAGLVIGYIYKNGAAVLQGCANAINAAAASISQNDVLFLALNDYLEAWVYQNSGGAAFTLSNGSNLTVHFLSQ